MTSWHLMALFITTIVVMHIFSATGSFRVSTKQVSSENLIVSLSYICTAFLVALTASILMLWVFGRVDGLALGQIVSNTIVLLFPAGIGAAAARLIL